MANNLNSSQRAAKRQRQLAWLKEHGLLEQLPNADRPPTDDERRMLGLVVADMLHDGLYCPTTDLRSLRWSVRRLVSEALGRPVCFTTRHLS